MRTKLWCLAVFAGLAALPLAQAGGAKQGFHRYVLKTSDGTDAPYYVFVPQGYTGDKAFPLIVFLHGSGETNNEKKLLQVGLPPAIKKSEKAFPFLVMVPMALTKGWNADGPNAKRMLAQLEEVKKNYKVDSKRIYLTGLSMGGSGSWSLAAAHPDLWAAVVPLCGRGDPASVSKMKDVPIHSFCGDKDKKETVENNREMAKALKAAGAGDVHYTEYPGVPHNCWDRAYATPELFAWLLKHSRK